MAFLRAADDAAPETRALAHVLAYTGCRISEALTLCRHQLDPSCHALTLRTLKWRRIAYRVVPIPREVTTMLLALPVHQQAPERFFVWHRSTAWRRIKTVMAAARLDGPQASPKGLRHGFGHRALQKNVPPSLAQRWLGHRDPRTTAIYQNAVGEDERAFAERMW